MATIALVGNMKASNNCLVILESRKSTREGTHTFKLVVNKLHVTPTVYVVAARRQSFRTDMPGRQNFSGGEIDFTCHSTLCREGFPVGFQQERNEESLAVGRRGLLIMLSALMPTASEAAEDQTMKVPLELYSDAKDGFKLLRPAPWEKVDKPGASIYFEDPNSKSNNIGVTVAPVRIPSLDAFGTVDGIVQKLVKAERDKPSTKDMQLVNVLEKKLRDNISLYSVEYTLDTTRGSKRVLTSVTVAAYKLYILNIVFTDSPVSPAPMVLNEALHQVLDSFELFA